jgi:hypothetical protein
VLGRIGAVLLLVLPGAAAARSLALVVGNDSYVEIEPLQKARADAAGYGDLFGRLGFEVTLATDLDARAMRVTLAAFYDSIAPGDTVVFAYSGHGWSDGQQNFLVPVDIRAQGSETLLAGESFAVRNGVNGIVDQIALRGPRLTVAIIDACRNNPFTPPPGSRSIGLARGLVPVQAPSGTFIAFSAGEGQTALDRLSDSDPVPYSVFTRFFLQELGKPQDLQAAFKATQAVVNETAKTVGHPQRPAYYDEVVGNACLTEGCDAAAPAPVAPVAPRAKDATERAAAEWQDFRNSNSVAALRAFAERHRDTPYAALAEERIAQLEAQAATPDTPAPRSDRPKLPRPEAPQPVVVPPVAPTPVAPTPVTPRMPVPPQGFARPDWCPRAATQTERAICADARLAELDIELGEVYAAAGRRLGAAAKRELSADQRDWLAYRDRCGADVACIEAVVDQRITDLLRR